MAFFLDILGIYVVCSFNEHSLCMGVGLFFLGHAAMFIRICGLKLANADSFPHCSGPNELSKLKSHAFNVSVKYSNLSPEVSSQTSDNADR